MTSNDLTRRLAIGLATTAALGAATMAIAPQAASASGSGSHRVATMPSPGGFDDEIGDVNHGVDIKAVSIVNGARNVRVTVTHANLRRSFRSGSSVAIFLDTRPAKKGPEYAFVGGTYEGADYSLVRTDGWKPQQQALTCSYRMRLDFAKETAAVRIARACLAKPGPVRVAVKTGGKQRDGDLVRDWLFKPRHFTPWIARG